MMRRKSYVLPCVLFALLALPGSAVAQSSGGTPSVTSTTVLKDRDNVIWDMAFLPDGAMFFTERCGGLSVRLPSGSVIPLLGIKDSKGYPQTASDLFCSGRGMALVFRPEPGVPEGTTDVALRRMLCTGGDAA